MLVEVTYSSHAACVLDCGGCDAALLLASGSHGVSSLQKPLVTFRSLQKGKIKNPFFLFGRRGMGLPRRSPVLRNEDGSALRSFSVGGSSPIKLSKALFKNYLSCRVIPSILFILSKNLCFICAYLWLNFFQPVSTQVRPCQPMSTTPGGEGGFRPLPPF